MTNYSLNDSDMAKILSLMEEQLENLRDAMKERTEKGLDNLLENNFPLVKTYTEYKNLYGYLKSRYDR